MTKNILLDCEICNIRVLKSLLFGTRFFVIKNDDTAPRAFPFYNIFWLIKFKLLSLHWRKYSQILFIYLFIYLFFSFAYNAKSFAVACIIFLLLPLYAVLVRKWWNAFYANFLSFVTQKVRGQDRNYNHDMVWHVISCVIGRLTTLLWNYEKIQFYEISL